MKMKISCVAVVLVIFTLLQLTYQEIPMKIKKCHCKDGVVRQMNGICSRSLYKEAFVYIETMDQTGYRKIGFGYNYACKNWNCNTVTTSLVCPVMSHKVIIKEIPRISFDGELIIPPERRTSEYCVDFVINSEGKMEHQYEFCVSYDPFPLCCAPNEVMNDYGECTVHGQVFPNVYNYEVNDIQCKDEEPFQEPIRGTDILEMESITSKPDNLRSLKSVFGYYNENSTVNFCMMAKQTGEEIRFFRKYCRCQGELCIESCCPSTQQYNFDTGACESSDVVYYTPPNIEFSSENVKYLSKSMTCNDTFILNLSDNRYLIMADGTLSPEIGQTIPKHFFCLGLIRRNNVTTSSGLGCLVDKPKTTVYRSCYAEASEEFLSFLNPSYPGFDPVLPQGRCVFRINVAPSVCKIRVDIAETHLAPPEKGKCINQFITVRGHIWPLGRSFKICGRNVNNHFYVEVMDNVEQPYVEVVISSNTLSTYKWALWISQIKCSEPSTLQSQSGCFQYHWENAGSLQSFSYLDNQYYSDQSYRICFLSSSNICKITFETEGQFMLEPIKEALYNTSSVSSLNCDRDYLRIPRGSSSGEYGDLSNDRFCGGKFAPLQWSTESLPISSPITSRVYYVEFVTGEPADWIADHHGPGFNLKYKMISCSSSEESINHSSTTAPVTERVTLQPPYYLKNVYHP